MFKQSAIAPASLCRYWAEKAFKTFYPFATYHGTEDAPGNWPELRALEASWKAGESLPVYNGGSTRTIYGSMSGNVMARAWHDSIHLDKGLGFSQADELATAREHIRQLQAIKAPHNVIATIWADTAGQVSYYYAHRAFLDDQLSFVEWLTANGNNLDLVTAYREKLAA